MKLGRFIGPLTIEIDLAHISRSGVIPMSHTPGRWRLITNLSHPPAARVNDGINPELCTLSYVTVEKVTKMVSQLRMGALLAKVDIESAYRLIPVHPDDWTLLAIRWKGDMYVDTRLPIGA